MTKVSQGRHFAWAKVALLQWMFTPETCSSAVRSVFEAWLSENRRKELVSSYEYVVWIDGDALVLNHEVPLSNFVSGRFGSKSLVVAEDMAWCDWINTGVMFIPTASKWAST